MTKIIDYGSIDCYLAKLEYRKMAKKTKQDQRDQSKKEKYLPHCWDPGQSGNPKGRPKSGCSWADVINKVSAEMYGKDQITKKEAVVRNILSIALGKKDRKAAIKALQVLSDRTDGKPHETIKMDGIVRDERYKNLTDAQLEKILKSDS